MKSLYNNYNNGSFARFLAVAVFCLAPFLGWGQDYSGVYYIASGGKAQANGSGYTYNSSNPANNFYLCPTEGWCFYQATNDFTGTDNGQPFFTTFKCRTNDYHSGDPSDAIWTIEKAPEPNSNYYYIKQTSTGKYMLSNGQIRTSTNADRIRVHLEAVTGDLDDKALFAIEPVSGQSYVVIRIVSTDGINGDHKWLSVCYGNYNNLIGNSGKNGGPTGYENVAGTVCIYTQNDANAPFYLEPATIDPPTITNNFDGTITITESTGATIYYTTDETTPTTTHYTGTGTNSIPVTLTDEMRVIKAIAKAADFNFPTAVRTYAIPACERPVITVNAGTVTITCATAGATIHYTTDDTPATPSSPEYNGSFSLGSAVGIRAIATKLGYVNSEEAFCYPEVVVHSSSEMISMHGNYILANDFTSTSSIGTAEAPFEGSIEGNLVVVSGLAYPLVAYSNGATIKNIILDNVTISGGTNIGAICNVAKGASRIYNCGVLATNSTVATDEDGYTNIITCSSTISGSGSVGGIVGILDDESRVINCFSYANITNGNLVGGIVGENKVATTSVPDNLKTMVMNCMFYGNITGGNSKAPIYNGEIISNKKDNHGVVGVSNFNYFWSGASYVQNKNIDVYNCALAAETRYLQRFEFFRRLLNSNRALAAWWVTGDQNDTGEIMKWVMEPSQIGTSTPYPILKTPGKYSSVVNYDTINVGAKPLNQGGKLGVLTVNIEMGSGAVYGPPTGAAITTSSLTLPILDKDTAHFNFNYYKVQLPYYNDVGTKNYNGNRVVTGWKIVSITGGTAGTYSTGEDVTFNASGEITSTPYNFADRHCTNKDLYSVSGRVFSQGAYWDVPEGVTAITIQPYWAKAAYLADGYADVVYDTVMAAKQDVPNVGGGSIYTNNTNYLIAGENQKVYTAINKARDALDITAATHGVNDYAVVLVGNYHQIDGIDKTKPYTVTSIDLDHDNEPDYNIILRFNGRTPFHAVKYDFVSLVGSGMAQKSTGGYGTYNFGIPQPVGWFELTNTSLFRVTQFEFDRNASGIARQDEPYILQGGVIEQWVSGQSTGVNNMTIYIHVGGNVWFKEFHLGCHQDKSDLKTKHPPVSVTGGDFDGFYLTGLYANTINYEDGAEGYVNGGRFGTVAGAGMEGIGNATTHEKGNITWLIDNADIKEFFAGGINAAKIAQGNLYTKISNSHVGYFYGGPKFGDMNSGRTVKTTADHCTFGYFFGAGYGGNSYYTAAPGNFTNIDDHWYSEDEKGYNLDWDQWIRGEIKGTHVNSGNYSNGVRYNGYWRHYIPQFGGVATAIDYQFLPFSSNEINVGRLQIKFVKFSLATTRTVTSTLTDCTIENNFYGGGSLGKVEGDVVSVLDGCTVKGDVFGAGYSATIPTVPAMNTGGFLEPEQGQEYPYNQPYYDKDLGVYLPGKFPNTIDYTWEHRATVNNTATAVDSVNHILYTTERLEKTELGSVKGDVTLTIKGHSTILGSVFGGGEESMVVNPNNSGKGNTEVRILDQTKVFGNIYGGGNMGEVQGDTKVIVNSGSGSGGGSGGSGGSGGGGN